MTRTPHRLAGLTAAALGLALLTGGPAAADTVPFTDAAARGSITLCDVRGKAVDSGDVRTKPFVWRAVGSQAPDPGYGGAGRTAALYAYQPVEGVDAGRWVGDYLTGSAQYTSGQRPMAAATAADPSLADLLDAYPTKWDGLYQLRMFLGAPGVATQSSSYSTATLRVEGTRWTLLSGGRSGCDTGTARSAELVVPSVAALGTPAPNATTTGPQAGRGSKAGSAAVTAPGASASGATGAASPATSGVAADASDAAASSSSDDGGAGTTWLVVGLVVVVLAAAGFVARRRFTRPAP